MEAVLFVRTPGAEGVAKRHPPADLAVEGGSVSVMAETLIGLREEGPFEPLAASIEKNGALRDELASGIPIPSLRGHTRLRLGVLAATALPMAMLLELDRELLLGHHASLGRLLVDIMLVAFVVFELLRRTPRMPGVAAISLVAIAFRWGLVAARLCGRGVHPLVYLGAAIPAIAAFILLARVPSRSRVALELLGKLGITRSAFFEAKRGPEPAAALVSACIACAAGLPAILHLAHALGAGLFTQGLALLAFAGLAPELARRTTDASPPRVTKVASSRVVFGVVVGFTLTGAILTAARLFFDTGAELARCLERLDSEARLARATEAVELARAIAKVRASVPLVIMTTAICPFAEERVYRGLLQDVLVRRYGTAYGVFAASIAFGLAHVGVYQAALYQTVLLGIGFGVAYVEGGFVAAVFVHATWNLLQLV